MWAIPVVALEIVLAITTSALRLRILVNVMSAILRVLAARSVDAMAIAVMAVCA